MLGKENCHWLVFSKHTYCNKRCVYDYCGRHRFQMRNGCVVKPCRVCGVGIISATGLCLQCGGHRAAQNLINIENRARKYFMLVMAHIRNNLKISY